DRIRRGLKPSGVSTINHLRMVYNLVVRYALVRTLLPAVHRTRPIKVAPRGSRTSGQCEVFMLTYDRDLDLALRAAKSFYFYAAVDWPLTWLQGGPISADTEKLLTGHFPANRVGKLRDYPTANSLDNLKSPTSAS